MLKQYRVIVLAVVAVLVALAAYAVGDADLGNTVSAVSNAVSPVISNSN